MAVHLEDRDEPLGQTGLLLPRDRHEAEFFHLSIQEFLAAQRIADVDAERIRDVFRERSARPEWRNTLSFLFGHLLATNTTPERAVRVLSDLIEPMRAADAGLQLVAADALEILARRGIRMAEGIETKLRDALLQTMRTAEAQERCRAGTALGRIGDPRFNADAWFLPVGDLLGFVEIPTGPFMMGSDKRQDEEALQRHSRVAANGRPLGRGGVTRGQRFSPSTPGVPAARTVRGGVGSSGLFADRPRRSALHADDTRHWSDNVRAPLLLAYRRTSIDGH